MMKGKEKRKGRGKKRNKWIGKCFTLEKKYTRITA
jgi:hypothetical protein